MSWLGGRRGLEASIVKGAGIPFRRLVLRSLRSTDRSIHLVLDPLRLAASVPQAAAILARDRPAAILTTGGYVAIPVLLAARGLGIPTILWEGNVMPGRSVRATARLASAVAVSFPETCAALAVAEDRCYRSGTPIRDFGSIDPVAARERFGVGPGERLLVVFGGSQAVRRFNAAVAEALPELVERVHLIHVTGDTGYAAALAGREALPPDRRARYRPYPFLGAEMADALVAADLIVGRAGSSTLAEATALGKPLVVVPYPHAAGHQRANARQLVEAGAGLAHRRRGVRRRERSSRPRPSSTIRPATPGWRLRRASWAGPAPPPPSASWSWPSLRARPLPDPDAIERRSREVAA